MNRDPALEPFDSDVESLLKAERDAPAPSAEVRARVWRGVETAAASAVVTGGGFALWSWLKTHGGVGSAALVMGAGLGAWLHAAMVKPEIVVVEKPVEVVREVRVEVPTVATPPVAAPAQATTEKPAPATKVKPATTEKSDDTGGVEAELALVEWARGALVRGDAKSAAAAIEKHRKQFKDGMLVEEREALAIQVHVALGEKDAAKQAAESFRQKWPKSLQWSAVERSLKYLE